MAKVAETPKAFVNVRNVGFAQIENMNEESTTYKQALLTRGVKSVSSESSSEPKVAYADGLEIESGRSNGSRTISLLMHEFSGEVRDYIFGDTPDSDGIVAEKRNAETPEVAFWFVHERKDGTYKVYLFPRCVFSEPNIEAVQEEDDYDWTEETSEGIAMYRTSDEVRRYVYDSRTEGGSLKKLLEKVFGASYEGLEDIAKNIDKTYTPEV